MYHYRLKFKSWATGVIGRFLGALPIALALVVIASATTIPFDPSRGLVEIPVTIDGRITGHFGIDTGADKLYLNRSFALQNDLIPAQTPANGHASGINGTSQAQDIAVGSLKIGDEATLMNVQGSVIDLGSLSQTSNGNNPDGLIGFDVLRQFYITIDYPAQTIEMRTDAPRYLDGRAYHTITFKPFRHLIMVDVTINGVNVPMALDYCSSYTIISPEIASKLGLTYDPANAFVQLAQANLSDDVQSSNVTAAVMSFDGYRHSYPQLEIQGLLGGTFLQSHVITVDYRTNHIYIPYR